MPGVRETVWLSNRAADLGYKAALIDSPHHRPETESLYFRSVADQSKIPLILAGDGPDLAAAAQHPNVIAVCDTNGRTSVPGVQVLVSSAAHLWPALQSGASGAILDFAAAAPYAAISIWEAHRTREEEGRHRLAEPHPARCRGDRRMLRRTRPETRHGPERLLWRTAAPAAGGAHG